MVNSDLNKQGDQVLSIRYSNIAPLNKLQAFGNELSMVPDLAVSDYGNHLPRKEGFPPLAYQATMPDKSNEKYTLDLMTIGPDFPKVYDLELIAGKFFDSSLAMDSSEVLVNESVARQLNVDPSELVGQQIAVQHARRTQEQYHFKIRGVLKDFKYRSMEHKILPLVLTTQGSGWDVIYYIKLPTAGIQENIATVQQIWKKVMPEDVGMSYWFISDEFNKMYFEENALHDLSRVFTVLAIITTCIGLFGMSMFLAERKSKEMAIRKVMGADTSDVLRKMIAPFLKLMAVACIIGLPIAYYLSNKWLDNFIYKVEWSWMSTFFSVLLILVVTLLTISFQSLKTANANPVNSLRE